MKAHDRERLQFSHKSKLVDPQVWMKYLCTAMGKKKKGTYKQNKKTPPSKQQTKKNKQTNKPNQNRKNPFILLALNPC